MVLVVAACESSPSDPSNTKATTTDTTESTDMGNDDVEQRARTLALDAAHTTLRALGSDEVDGASRVLVCTDAFGAPNAQWLGEYNSGDDIGPGSVTDEQVGALAELLDVEFLQDSTDIADTRLVVFVLPVDGVDVTVRLSRPSDGSLTLTTSTSCID